MPALPISPMPREISAAELLAANLPSRQAILDPILSTKSLALLYGPRGLGKTFVALGIAWAAASGGSFLGWRAPRAHRVVYVDGEMPAVDMQERVRLMGPVPPGLHFILADTNSRGIPDLGREENQALLWKNMAKPPELLVLDNLASLVGTHHNGSDRWAHVQNFLMILRRYDVAVLVVHHASKRGHQRGTSRREDMLDLVLSLRRPADYDPKEGARFEIHFEKTRGLWGEHTHPIEARLQTDPRTCLAQWHWRPAHDADLERVAALLKTGLNPNQVARELGMSKSKSYRLRQRVVEMGLVA